VYTSVVGIVMQHIRQLQLESKCDDDGSGGGRYSFDSWEAGRWTGAPSPSSCQT
jgi:hypothetical protein